ASATATCRGVGADRTVADRQTPRVPDTAAAVIDHGAVGDRQTRERDGDRRGYVEDPKRLIAADRDQASPRTEDGNVLSDGQSGGRQRDRAAQAGLKVHGASG